MDTYDKFWKSSTFNIATHRKELAHVLYLNSSVGATLGHMGIELTPMHWSLDVMICKVWSSSKEI